MENLKSGTKFKKFNEPGYRETEKARQTREKLETAIDGGTENSSIEFGFSGVSFRDR